MDGRDSVSLTTLFLSFCGVWIQVAAEDGLGGESGSKDFFLGRRASTAWSWTLWGKVLESLGSMDESKMIGWVCHNATFDL